MAVSPVLPTPGGDRDEWGTPLNDALQTLIDGVNANADGLTTKPTLTNGLVDASVIPDLSATYANLAGATFSGALQAPIRDNGGQVYNVLHSAFGAKGDGVTDDTAAITAAITAASTAGGGTVFFPYTANGYAHGALILKTGVKLAGASRLVKLKRIGASSVVMVNATNVTDTAIEDLTLDSAGLSTAATVRASTGAQRMAIRRVTFLDSAQPAGVYALDTQGCTTLLVEDCRFVNMPNNIRLNTGATDVTIRGCRFTGWKERCIYVLGAATYSCTDVTIEHCRFSDMAAGGSVRQPLAVQGNNAMPHQRVHLLFNTAIGTFTSVNDPVTPGTADLLSIQHTVDFQVIGNRSFGSGDVGITVAEQSTRGVIVGNVVRGANSCGIAIGAGTTTDVGHLAITGNTLMNNGKDTQGDRTTNRGGVWMRNAHSVVCGNNVMGDDQVTKTQQSGYILLSCDNINIGTDVNAGVAGSMIDTSGGGVTNSFKAAAPVAL